ncbi:MAG: DUF4298 domain-containing protein [Pseudomonadota bacterium]|nr:DUF4298 domain-containing protein [Pseudomonadota bacterium]
MTLSKKDIAKLTRMNDLCEQVEADNQAIAQLCKRLKKSDKTSRELLDLYEKHWLELAEPGKLSDEQRREIDALAKKGRYSVLAQDTVWNALSDQHALRIKLLKALVKEI